MRCFRACSILTGITVGAVLFVLTDVSSGADSGAPPAVALTSPSQSSDSLTIQQLQAQIAGLERDISEMASSDPYIVIDRTHNRLQLRQGDRILSERVCATGSGRVLLGDGGKSWSFETPRGVYAIQRKVTDPVWSKPEWAFVEAGTARPVLPWMFERLDAATLGDYALQLGDGYEIHGTLYPSLLGRNITHGCIRLNDADLETVFSTSRVGTTVIVY